MQEDLEGSSQVIFGDSDRRCDAYATPGGFAGYKHAALLAFQNDLRGPAIADLKRERRTGKVELTERWIALQQNLQEGRE